MNEEINNLIGLTGLSHQHNSEAYVRPQVIQCLQPVHRAFHCSMIPVLQAHRCVPQPNQQCAIVSVIFPAGVRDINVID